LLNPLYTNQFAKDLKLAQKRGKNIEKLKAIIKLLINGDKLLLKGCFSLKHIKYKLSLIFHSLYRLLLELITPVY